MKTAIYIEDGVIQLVLTPETAFEKSTLGSFSDKSLEVKIFSGSFYDCRGGWTRQREHYHYNYGGNTDDRTMSQGRCETPRRRARDRRASRAVKPLWASGVCWTAGRSRQFN